MRIYITHVAGRVDPDLYQRGVDHLRAAGAECFHDERFLHPTHPYLADASDESRAADLVAAFRTPGIDAIIAARGGFGTMRTLACLRGEPLLNAPSAPPLVGFSDITALHLYLQNRNLPAIHGPVVTALGAASGADAAVELLNCLRVPYPSPPVSLGWLLPPAYETIRQTAPPTRLVGGNLALLAANTALLEPLLRDSLLFLEDVGEAPYRLDRTLQTLRPLITRRPPRAILLGDFTRCGDPDQVRACLLDALSPWNLPVAAGLPVGHGERNMPLRLDCLWRLDPSDPTHPVLRSTSILPESDASAPRAATVPRVRFSASGRTADLDGAGRPPVPGTPPARAHALNPVPDPASTALNARLGELSDQIVEHAASAVAIRVSVGEELIVSVDRGMTFDPQWTPVLGDAHPVDASCVFDLASVTKALCTAILVHHAVDEGAGRLTDRLEPSLSLATPALLELLRHSSGFPAHLPFFESCRHVLPTPPKPADVAAMADRWRRVAPVAPAGLSTTYSDVGYILLGRWLEAVADMPLDVLFERCIAAPLGLRTLAFRPWSAGVDSDPHAGRPIAATELCPWRGVPLHGIVHDENAQHLGAVAGHAGLFGTADDVLAVVQDLLSATPRVMSARARDRMWDPQLSLPGSTWVCGWDTPSAVGSTAGRGHTPAATFGHLGFTGTSVWVDRARQLTVVMLTNRVHRGRQQPGFNEWRRAVHQSVLDAFGWSTVG